MNGIPVRIYRDQGVETIYLSTRRSGEQGEEMKRLKRDVHQHQLDATAALTLIATVGKKIDDDTVTVEETKTIIEQQTELAIKAREHNEAMLEAAEKLLRCSLAVNYPPDEVNRIVDSLSDRQIRSAVTAIETGEEPKDFFLPRAIPQNASTT